MRPSRFVHKYDKGMWQTPSIESESDAWRGDAMSVLTAEAQNPGYVEWAVRVLAIAALIVAPIALGLV